MNWLTALIGQTAPSVLVTVAAVQGSAPREPGAKMLVTDTALFDTIGGGHLELRACEIARGMLASGMVEPRRLERFALGPSLGQCCGGVVHLMFESIGQDAHALFQSLQRSHMQRRDCWRLVALDSDLPACLSDAAGNRIAGGTTPVRFDNAQPCHIAQDAQGRRWLIDPMPARRPHLLLFGAGHVGAAIVRALAELPCHVTWIDEREDLFPPEVPANVATEATDMPEAPIDAAAPGSSFLVMTHSHALDLRLAEHILRRGDHGWFGLIGSDTKRVRFEHRLRERGIAPERLASMTCPIGVPGISGKEPAVIAVAVCAQLLQVWETAQRRT